MREESDSVKDIPEWLQKGMQENNVPYEQVLRYMTSIRNAMEDNEYERRIKLYSKYIGKYYKEPYNYDTNGAEIGYYYYKILGLSRLYNPRCIFDTLSFASDPEYVVKDYDVKLDGILVMDTISAYGIDSLLEEISEEEYRKALHNSMDYLLSIKPPTLQEN